MSMKKIRIIALAILTGTVGTAVLVQGVQAQTAISSTQTPLQTTRINVSELAKKLEQAGYHIHDIDRKHFGWEVEVTDNNHQRLELHVDNQGNITSQEFDD
ncbi:PepSY domain-containing protein [Bartonella sp. LJL80]